MLRTIVSQLKDLVGLGAPKETVEIPKGQENLPNYFRIEAQIVRLDNQGGLQADGSRCDRRDECDTLVYAYLDTYVLRGFLSPDARRVRAIFGRAPQREWPRGSRIL